MPKEYWRDKQTGKIVEVEVGEDGKRYVPSAPSAKKDAFFNPDPSKPSTITAPTWEDKFYNLVGRHVRPGLAALGGMVGGLVGSGVPGVGTVLGGAGGAGMGAAGGLQLQTSFPRLFGEPPSYGLANELGPNIGAAVDRSAGVAGDIAADLLGSGIGHVLGGVVVPAFRRAHTQEFIKSHYPVDPAVARLAPVGQTNLMPQLDLTVGQMNKNAGRLEDLWASREKEAIVGEQRNTIDQFFRSRQPGTFATEPIIQTGQATGKANVEAWKTRSDQLYEAFEPHIAKNTRDVQFVSPVKSVGFAGGGLQPVTRTVKVPGAIEVIDSARFANKVGADLDRILGPNNINEANIGGGLGTPLRELRDELNKIRGIRVRIDPATGQHMPNPIVEFKQLNAIKKSLNRYIDSRNGFGQVLNSETMGALKGLAGTIDQDIKAGVAKWGPRAEVAYNRAQNYYRDFLKKVNPEAAQNILKAGGDYELTAMETASQILSDPQHIRSAINLTGDRGLFKKLFVNSMVENAWDPVKNTYSPGAALDYMLKNKKEVAREVLNDVERGEITNWLRKATNVKDVQGGGRWGLDTWLARSALFAGTGLTSAIAGADLPTSAKIGGASLLAPEIMKKIVTKTLLDPKYRAIVAGTRGVDPISKKGQALFAAIMGGVKSAQVMGMSGEERMPPPSGISDEEKIRQLMREKGTEMLPYESVPR